MSKERDLLRRVVGWWDDDNDLGYPDSLIEEIRAFLEVEKQYDTLSEHYVEGLSNSIKAYKEYFEREEERVMELFSTPSPFIRLTDEEIKNCWGEPTSLNTQALITFARAIEDALEEKNK
jgi:hypothetical protein